MNIKMLTQIDILLKAIKDFKVHFIIFSIFINTFVIGYFMHGFYFGFKALELSQILIAISIGIFISLPIFIISFFVLFSVSVEEGRGDIESTAILSSTMTTFMTLIIMYVSFGNWYDSGFKNLIYDKLRLPIMFVSFFSYKFSFIESYFLLLTTFGIISYILLGEKWKIFFKK